jgi:hypothetical protein
LGVVSLRAALGRALEPELDAPIGGLGEEVSGSLVHPLISELLR